MVGAKSAAPSPAPDSANTFKQLIVTSWAIAGPMTLIMLFEFAIAFTDVFIAGRIGKEVQAAYGLVTQIYFIFTILGNAFTAGTVAVVSRLAADKEGPDYSRALATSLAGTLGAGLVLGLSGILLSPVIIRLLDVPAEIKPYAVPLISIFAAALIFQYILINTNGLLRASGRVRESLATMTVVCLANVGLNFLLTFHTPLGFRGIALSTALAVTMGSVVNLARFRSSLKGGLRMARDLLKKMVSIGWPVGLLQVLWQLASMALFLILSQLPERRVEVLAAFTNGLRIESIIFLPAFAFNMANAVIIGTFLGKKETDHAYRGGMATAALGVAVVTLLTGLVLLNARAIAGLVTPNPIVAEETVRYLYIAFLSEPLMAWGVILAGGLSGAGDTRATMLRIAGSVWLVRIPAAYIFGITLGYGAPAVWWAMNASLLVQAALITHRYMKRRWMKPE
jgi:putative MATE family efflux protein